MHEDAITVLLHIPDYQGQSLSLMFYRLLELQLPEVLRYMSTSLSARLTAGDKATTRAGHRTALTATDNAARGRPPAARGCGWQKFPVG